MRRHLQTVGIVLLIAIAATLGSPLGAQAIVRIYGTLSTGAPIRLLAETNGSLDVTVVGGSFSVPVVGPASGTCATPSHTFAGDLDSGLGWLGANNIGLCVFGAAVVDVNTARIAITLPLHAPAGIVTAPSVRVGSTLGFYDAGSGFLAVTNSTTLLGHWSSTGISANAITLDVASGDVVVKRDGAGVHAWKNGANAQAGRLYFNETGPIYTMTSARTAGIVYTAEGGSFQLSTAQTTAPTCSANCGTSPSVAGTDTAGIVTMGATGVPASGWVVTFNGTWPAAPSCTVTMALAGMAVGKLPLTVVASTTTMTVVTNGTAPSTSDKYAYTCVGVS